MRKLTSRTAPRDRRCVKLPSQAASAAARHALPGIEPGTEPRFRAAPAVIIQGCRPCTGRSRLVSGTWTTKTESAALIPGRRLSFNPGFRRTRACDRNENDVPLRTGFYIHVLFWSLAMMAFTECGGHGCSRKGFSNRPPSCWVQRSIQMPASMRTTFFAPRPRAETSR